MNIYIVIKKVGKTLLHIFTNRAVQLSQPSEIFFTALLLAGNHPAHVDVVVGEDVLGFLDGGIRQGSFSAQDPGEVDMEEPQDIRARIHKGRVHVVSGQDPVRGVGQDCGEGIRVKITRSLKIFLLEDQAI